MKKYNLVIPLSGKGSRMITGGFKLPKPMLIAGNKSILEWSMDSIATHECNLIFVVRKEHVDNFSIDSWLKQLHGNDIHIVQLKNETSGAVETVYLGLNLLVKEKNVISSGLASYFDTNKTSSSLPLIIYCPDTTFSPKYIPSEKDFNDDGFILTFKANSSNYSYLKLDSDNRVIEAKEKEVISNIACVGLYCFSDTDMFMSYAFKYINNENGKEKHICPIYNDYIKDGFTIRHRNIDSVHVMGTPEEFNFFERVAYPFFLPRKFVLCCDHSGFGTKLNMIKLLNRHEVEFIDVGAFSAKDCDYNNYVEAAVRVIQRNEGYFGLGFCRTGQGVNICANKHKSVNSCLVVNDHYAEKAIKHNAGNFFCVPDLPISELDKILLSLLSNKFEGGRHQLRMMKNGN